ncbi:D-lactaldehyde dehydrogenase [Trametopsis cervina]|nr:D-lactaldehyde dehydrogenase [Trametopsis cervina]
MPAITDKGSNILVTGANGFIGTWIVGDLLERGYNVRAAVRSEDKGRHLLDIYKKYENKLKLIAVGDMDAKGAWDEPVKGVDGVIHTAAAVHQHAKTPEEIIEPAVQGVLGLLNSVHKYGTSVKRIVFTSSCATITKGYSSVPVSVSEEDWNDAAVKECEEKGANASPLDMYCASKTLSERAAWDWYNKHKSEISWDIVTLLPPWVFGPMRHHVPSLSAFGGSNRYLYNAITLGDFLGDSPLSTPGHGVCDVRDISEGHIRALEIPEAGGERILLVQSRFVWQDAVDAAHAVKPSPWVSHTAPFVRGEPDGERVRNVTWAPEKEQRILGVKFRSIEETMKDILEDYEKHGWA